MHEVYEGPDGVTTVSGRAAIRAVSHELEEITGVAGVEARINGTQMHVDILVDDRADVAAIEAEARRRLDHGFWIGLGLADFALSLSVTHHPSPPRVR